MKIKKQISFGPSEPDLSTQLKGLVDEPVALAIDLDMYCLNRAYVQGYLSEALFEQAVGVLIRRIQRAIESKNKFAAEFPLLASAPSALSAVKPAQK